MIFDLEQGQHLLSSYLWSLQGLLVLHPLWFHPCFSIRTQGSGMDYWRQLFKISQDVLPWFLCFTVFLCGRLVKFELLKLFCVSFALECINKNRWSQSRISRCMKKLFVLIPLKAFHSHPRRCDKFMEKIFNTLILTLVYGISQFIFTFESRCDADPLSRESYFSYFILNM